ncbi:hypothetical protein GH714_008927 [Hevea brasiliensis]|uniref:Uncharacterized protein n=1 Tax=Hevea brasiliensis TaxID=3981 RepID=A0A6A6MID0_HEVBR|nr:hypothetical protein GH714_008927 [Hevea brasiliensis]
MRPTRTLTSTATTITSVPPPAITQQRSPWHSPVPYLFGGLAAMLGLIAFALFILACSYWRLSGRLEDNEDGDQRDLESGNEKEGHAGKAEKIYEEKILVIMAGDQKPTFLATPVSSRASAFDDKNSKIDNKEEVKPENGDKTKGEIAIGFNVETVQYNNIKFQVWDLGGQTSIRPYWRCYFPNTQAVIYVVDSSDTDRIGIAKEEFHAILEEEELKGAVVLIFANKQDLPGALDDAAVTEALELHKIKNRQWAIFKTCAVKGEGLSEGMDWLSNTLKSGGLTLSEEVHAWSDLNCYCH